MSRVEETTRQAPCGCTIRVRTAHYEATNKTVIEAVTMVAHCSNPHDGWY